MKPVRIANANIQLGPPVNWNDITDSAKCDTIICRSVNLPDIFQRTLETAYKPTQEELDMLNAGGYVVLRVIGDFPPVALYTEIKE